MSEDPEIVPKTQIQEGQKQIPNTEPTEQNQKNYAPKTYDQKHADPYCTESVQVQPPMSVQHDLCIQAGQGSACVQGPWNIH